MQVEDRLLFALARQDFLPHGLDLRAGEKVDWDLLCSTSDYHRLAPLIYTNLLRCNPVEIGIPQAVVARFEHYGRRNDVFTSLVADQIEQALAFLRRKSLDVMLIKRAALDLQVYDHRWYVVSDDIDLIIKARRDELAKADLVEIESHFGSIRLEYDDIPPTRVFEWDYFEHHDVTMNGVLDVDFERVWRDAAQIAYRGLDVYVMCPEDLLIAVCINSCRHRFFRLRSLFDIAETLNRRRDLSWPRLVSKARDYGCGNIVYAALVVARMTVGCAVSDGNLDALGVHPARAAVIRSVARGLVRQSSLSAPSRTSGLAMKGRSLNPALMLTYATYTWPQIGRKLAEIRRADTRLRTRRPFPG